MIKHNDHSSFFRRRSRKAEQRTDYRVTAISKDANIEKPQLTSYFIVWVSSGKLYLKFRVSSDLFLTSVVRILEHDRLFGSAKSSFCLSKAMEINHSLIQVRLNLSPSMI